MEQYCKQKLKKSQNYWFVNSQRELYSFLHILSCDHNVFHKLMGECDTQTICNVGIWILQMMLICNKSQIRKTSNNLWSCDVYHNNNADWLLALKRLFADPVCDQAEFTITSVSKSQAIKRFANWKVPGTDAVHAVWLKHLPSLHQRIAAQLQQVLTNGAQFG